MLKFFSNILGEDYNILQNDTPDSRKKISLFGSVLFIPVFLWLFQGFGLSYVILNGTIWSGILTGLAFAFIIFILERAILMAPSNGKILALRLILGALIAILGSIIIDEIIFHDDINTHMSVYKDDQLKTEFSKIDSVYADQLSALQDQADQKYDVWNSALEEVKAEADGTGGSGIKGVSEITKVKMQLTEQQEQSYNDAVAQLRQLNAHVDSLKLAKSNSYTAGFKEYGLLTRLKVLFSFIFQDKISIIIYSIITLFLFMLEFIVVFLKISYNKTNYDEKLFAMESMGKTRSRMMMERHNSRFKAERYSPEYVESERLINNGGGTFLN